MVGDLNQMVQLVQQLLARRVNLKKRRYFGTSWLVTWTRWYSWYSSFLLVEWTWTEDDFLLKQKKTAIQSALTQQNFLSTLNLHRSVKMMRHRTAIFFCTSGAYFITGSSLKNARPPYQNIKETVFRYKNYYVYLESRRPIFREPQPNVMMFSEQTEKGCNNKSRIFLRQKENAKA